jgi:zinc protease
LGLVALVLVLVSLPAWRLAGAEPAAPKKIVTIEGITEYQLDNGLRVLLFPDTSRPTVTVNLTVFVGSRHEGYGETGMAHLLEHMVFKGTPTHPNIPKALQERGARFNGTTWVDRTNYFETLPASDANLEFAIRLEADRLVNSFIKREDLLSEMTVVRNEFEMGENSPTRVLQQRIMAAAFEWHNYGKATIGNRSDIERVPIENLQAFYRKYYQPDNAMLVVAGQFDEAKALEYIRKYFGAIPRPERKLATTYTEEPPQDGERLVTLRRVGDVGAVGVAYHIPAGPHEEHPALEVLAQILTAPPSGRLYKELVEAKKATSVSGSAYAFHDPGVLMIMAEVRRENSLDDARDTLLGVLDRVAREGVTAEEVERAKRRILSARELAASNTSQLAVALSEWAALGDWRLYFIHRDRIENVTAEQVNAAARKYLLRNNRTVGLYIPTQQPERVAIPATPDVKTLVQGYTGRGPVAAGEAFDATPANVEARTRRIKLADGVQLVLLPKKTRGEAVHVLVTLRYGNEENLKNLVAAAQVLPDLMIRGTRTHTYQQLRDELDRLQARLTAFGGTGTATFAVETKRANLAAVLELLRQVLREPALAESEFEVLKRQTLARLEQSRSDPQTLARLTLMRQLSPYGQEDVRYVATVDEAIAQTRAMTVEQVRRLHREYLGGHAGEVAVVGDFDVDNTVQLLTRTFADWKPTQPYARIAYTARTDRPGGKQTILTPDKANATYMAGLVVPMRDDDPDYPALVLANYILGGGTLSSRLGDRVRQKEGLSYGISSRYGASSFDKRATFTIGAICNPQNMDRLEACVQEELERFLRDGVTDAELQRAKEGYLQQLRLSRTNDRSLAVLLANTAEQGRTMAYYADLEKKIEALTPGQVRDALRTHVDPKKLVIVTAGDFAKK